MAMHDIRSGVSGDGGWPVRGLAGGMGRATLLLFAYDISGGRMLRERLQEALKEAIASKDVTASSTLRLILAALRDRDLAARNEGHAAGVDDDMIVQMLESMVRQRHESEEMYTRSGRGELARQEAEEVAVIERFLPGRMDEPAMEAAVSVTIAELGAAGAKDMGRVMSTLKQRYPGRMDFERAGTLVKSALVLGTPDH